MATVLFLLILGGILLLLETILPGLIAGIVGIGCLIAGVILAYVRMGVSTGNTVALCVMVFLVIGTFLWIKYFPDSPMARPFISEGKIGNIGAEKPELLNQTGVAQTPLRPSGSALINGKKVDVISEGNMIPRGAAIKVVAIEGLRVVVRTV